MKRRESRPPPESSLGFHAPAEATVELRRAAASLNQRLALVLAGSADWTRKAATAVVSGSTTTSAVWLSNRPLPFPHQPLSGGRNLLGSEVDILVFDAYSGFDPDSFAAALGSVRGGGLLVLLTPPLEDWPALPDPEAARIAVHPFSTEAVGGRFLDRFVRVLKASPGVVLMRQGQPSAIRMSLPLSAGSGSNREATLPTPDQVHAVEVILAAARGRARRPVVLTSDRGRGKSSALGIAAAKLLATGTRTIVVTAPRRHSVDPLFLHASRLLPGAQVQRNCISSGSSTLAFQPPDALCLARQNADLLLVDEAAGIPAPLLERMLDVYPRVVFASTVHGYEGTGRGFEVRFRRRLEQRTPGWQEFRLETPVRYASGDPLEALAARALLLDAEPAADSAVLTASPDQCRFECLDRDALSRDDFVLSQVFGLLVLAHYQTRPMDLRHLLDGPNVEVYVLRLDGRIVATALTAREGGFDPDLAKQIFDGRRRPRGNLLPQTLSAHAGLAHAPGLRFLRIVRIAVHPAVQRRGLGKRLVAGIVAGTRHSGIDLAGTSFGATRDLVTFWLGCGFLPAHIGTARSATSGAHAAVMLRPLTAAGETLHVTSWRRLAARLPVLLADPLRDIEPDVAAILLESLPPSTPVPAPEADELLEIRAFADALRPYEAVYPPLNRLVAAHLGVALRNHRLKVRERDALIGKVLQNRSWREVASMAGVAGRNGVVSVLRRATGKLLGGLGRED